jgi:hypothetical protein
MKRRTFDVLASMVGLGLAVVLVIAGGLLSWAHNFVQDEVHSQLAAQRIYFPDKGSDSLNALKGDDYRAMSKYAGQQLTTGAQAQAYADHFIAVHLKGIGGGKTYAELSGAALQDPTNTDLQNQVATMFKGETLRGLLLNAYAFGKMGTIAGIAAVVAYIGAGVMFILGGLGLWHARRVADDREFLTGHHESLNPALT